jgi:hypothetical protein
MEKDEQGSVMKLVWLGKRLSYDLGLVYEIRVSILQENGNPI